MALLALYDIALMGCYSKDAFSLMLTYMGT